jgi:hypothetical protein
LNLTGLKKLCLKDFDVVAPRDLRDEGWLASLSQLPTGLEHLSINGDIRCVGYDPLPLVFSTSVLQRLQQLTYLELVWMVLAGPDQGSPALQPLQALTRLADLRLYPYSEDEPVTCKTLSSKCCQTCLQLTGCAIEPGVIAGKTALQHLHLPECRPFGGAAGAV